MRWIRRARHDADTWSGEIPLAEESERYTLDILSGDDVVRSLAVTQPSAFYSAAAEIADFGAPQPNLAVRVSQLSATVGAGIPAHAVLPL